MTVLNQPAHKRPENLTIDSPEPAEPGCLSPSRDHIKVPSIQGARKQKKSSRSLPPTVPVRCPGPGWWFCPGGQRSTEISLQLIGCLVGTVHRPQPLRGPAFSAHLHFPLLWSSPPPPPGRSTSASSRSTCSPSPPRSLRADAILGDEGLLAGCPLDFCVSGPQMRGMLESPQLNPPPPPSRQSEK